MAVYRKYVKNVTFCGNKYKGIRYLLDVEFRKGNEGKIALVIMQNPSKADENDSDITITAVLNRLQRFGYSEVYLANLIPFYGTDSATIKELTVNSCSNHAYVKNDDVLSIIVNKDLKIFVAWGDKNSFNEKLYNNRIARIHGLLKDKKVYCSGLTDQNNPRHPSRGGWPKDQPESSYILYNEWPV